MTNGSYNSSDLSTLQADIRDLKLVIYGDQMKRVKGLLESVAFLVDSEQKRVLRDAELKMLLRIMIALSSLAGLSSTGALLPVLLRVLGGGSTP